MGLTPRDTFECPKCFKTFNFKCRLTMHLVTHDPDAQVKCQRCGKISKNPIALYQHMRRRHTDQKLPSFDICRRLFQDSVTLRKQVNDSTSERSRLQCGFLGCEKTFPDKFQVSRHVKTNHPENPVRFSCTLCGKEFKRREHLESHIYTHTGEKPFKCATCGRGFAQKVAQKRHEVVHLETSFREMFKCQVCPRTFVAKRSLQYHIRASHEDQRNYPCKFRLQRFATSSPTRRHVDLRHPANKERIYFCDKCEYKSRSEADLAAHHLSRHNDANGHECYFCRKQFFYFRQLVKHCGRAHTLEKLKYKAQKYIS